MANIDRRMLLVGVGVLTLFILVILLLPRGEGRTRTESYKDVSGAAGLDATITHDGKPVSGITVYMLKDDGQQVAVVQPNKDGKVNLALQEGNYVMLIGKRIDSDKVFPQEPLALKNGKMLELKLRY